MTKDQIHAYHQAVFEDLKRLRQVVIGLNRTHVELENILICLAEDNSSPYYRQDSEKADRLTVYKMALQQTCDEIYATLPHNQECFEMYMEVHPEASDDALWQWAIKDGPDVGLTSDRAAAREATIRRLTGTPLFVQQPKPRRIA